VHGWDSAEVEPKQRSAGRGLSEGYGPLIYRLLGAVGLVALVWLTGLVIQAQIHSSRAGIERQEIRIAELEERFATLRRETRRLGAPDRMLPKVTAGRPSPNQRR